MPVTVVVGGQYGSEGKGKVAHVLAQEAGPGVITVRVGGSNSGHTIIGDDGKPLVLRQLPTAAWLPDAALVLPPGSYLDPDLLMEEIEATGVTPERLRVHPDAAIIEGRDIARERASGLRLQIGSTESGTGSAVLRRVARDGTLRRARDIPRLQPYLDDTSAFLRRRLDESARVVIEGTQGFGLSNLHGGHGDYATSRDTTAAGFVSEAGLSPLDVDQVVMVIRAHPIRVAGRSGDLPRETTWERVAASAGRPGLEERTTVTGRIRRVANFDATVVRQALAANRPTCLVLNHVDYVAPTGAGHEGTVLRFVEGVEKSVGREIDLVGLGPTNLTGRHELAGSGAAVSGHPWRMK